MDVSYDIDVLLGWRGEKKRTDHEPTRLFPPFPLSSFFPPFLLSCVLPSRTSFFSGEAVVVVVVVDVPVARG